MESGSEKLNLYPVPHTSILTADSTILLHAECNAPCIFKYQHVCISIENTVDIDVPRFFSLPQGIILSILDLNYTMPDAINNTDTLISDLYICS